MRACAFTHIVTLHTYIHTIYRVVRGVTVSIVGNGHSESNSNPG